MPTFPSNPKTPPPNLGKPNPSIILRRNAGRTPGRKAWHRGTRDLSRRAVRDPLRRGARDPGRDTGHTTRHHPEPAPTSTNTPHHSTPRKTRGESAREWVGGEGCVSEGTG